MQILDIVMRYLHVVAAILALGGLAFWAMCFTPAVRLLDEALRGSVMQLAQRKFRIAVWHAMAILIITGVYNWIRAASTYKVMGPQGNAVIGTKVLLAAILFGIIWAESVGWIKPAKPGKLLAIKLILGGVIVLLASMLRIWGKGI